MFNIKFLHYFAPLSLCALVQLVVNLESLNSKDHGHEFRVDINHAMRFSIAFV